MVDVPHAEDTRPDQYYPPDSSAPSTVWNATENPPGDVGVHTLILGGVIATAGIVIVGIVVLHLVKANQPPPPMPVQQAYVAPEVTEPEEETVPLAEQPKFSIRSEPMGAAVYIGKERLGRTPFVIRGERVDGSKVTLRYEMDNFISVEHKTRLNDGGVADVTLSKAGGSSQQLPGGLSIPGLGGGGGGGGLGDLRSTFLRASGSGMGGGPQGNSSPEGALVVGGDED